MTMHLTESRSLALPAAITEEAAGWFATMLDPDVSAEDSRAFRAWIGQGPLQAHAYSEMEKVWSCAVGLPDRTGGQSRRNVLRGMAGLGLIAGLGGWWAMRARPDFSSARGQVMAAGLPGGTAVVLSAASELAMDRNTPGVREDRVRVIAGSAWFESGPGGVRVEANGLRLRANGADSAFAVNLLARGPRAMVERGEVFVSTRAGDITLGAGEVFTLDKTSGAYSRETRDVAALLSWREGKLTFEQEPLDNIIAELNHWRPGHLMLMDGSLHSRRATLILPSTGREKTDLALSEGLGLRLVNVTPALTLVYGTA